MSAEEGALSSGVGEGPALSRAEALRTEGAAPNSSASDSEAGPSHPSSRNGLDRGAACPGGVRWASQRGAPPAGHTHAARCDSGPTSGLGTPQVTDHTALLSEPQKLLSRMVGFTLGSYSLAEHLLQADEAQERADDAEEEGAGDSDGVERADRKERPRKPHLQVCSCPTPGLAGHGPAYGGTLIVRPA